MGARPLRSLPRTGQEDRRASEILLGRLKKGGGPRFRPRDGTSSLDCRERGAWAEDGDFLRRPETAKPVMSGVAVLSDARQARMPAGLFRK